MAARTAGFVLSIAMPLILVRVFDPVQFGASDLVAFGPVVGASSGTIYLTDGTDAWGVVLFGPSCRLRVWHWDRRRGWKRR